MGVLDAPGLSPKTAANLYATKSAIIRATPRRREANAAMLTSGGSFTGPGTYTLADTTDFSLGSSSAKIVTNGAGGYCAYIFPALSWDLTNAAVRLYLKIDSYTNLNFVLLDLGSDSAFNNRYEVGLGDPANRDTIRVVRENEWLVLDLPKSVFSVNAGTPSWSNIVAARVACTDKNGVATTVRVGGIAKVPNATTLLPNGAAVFSFDDSYVSHFTIAKPKLDSVGGPGVCYPIADAVGSTGLSLTQLKAMRDISGWEIGTHALSSADHAQGFAGLTAAQVTSKFDQLKAWAATNGFTSDTHAWPLGDSDVNAETIAKQYVSSARGTKAGVQPAGMANPYRMMTTDTGNGTTLATMKARIDDAKAGSHVAIYMTHDIVSANRTGSQTLRSDWEALVDYSVAQGVPIMTLSNVMRTLQLI